MLQLVRSDAPEDGGALAHMARRLAQGLRNARLSVVVGSPGTDASSLLARVLPLLQRRAIDVSISPGAVPGVVVPFPDRRARGSEGAQRERILKIDHWDDASMQTLRRALDDDLSVRARRQLADALTPGNLVAHIERHGGARLLFVFDHFEELLQATRSRVGLRRLVDTWAAAARSPQLRANFLVAVDERAWPWMHAVCVGLPQGSWSAMRLHAPQGECLLEPLTQPQATARTLTRPPLAVAPRPGKSPRSTDFLDSVNARVRRVAESAREQAPDQKPADGPSPDKQIVDIQQAGDSQACEPQSRDDGAPAPTVSPAESIAAGAGSEPVTTEPVAEPRTPQIQPPAAAAPIEITIPDAPATLSSPSPRRLLPALLGLSALALGAVLTAAWWWRTHSEPLSAATQPAPVAMAPTQAPPSAAPAPTPQPPAASAAAPDSAHAFDVVGVNAGGEHARIARELVVALAGDGPAARIELLARNSDPVAWLQKAPGRLGIARWDALRAASHASGAAPLRVLTPLFAEPVLFVVRADSPLRTLRQLQGRRINIGPARSDAAHSVRELLRRLHGAAPTDTTTLAPDEAVAELVAFGAIDAIAVVDAQPMAWWRALDPAVAARLRTLTLDPTHPQDAQLLDSMGTPPLHVSLPGAQGGVALVPAVMSYLVASGEADPGSEQLSAMAQTLCRELPQLQKQGHPAWRDLRPRAQTDTGWPVASAFRSTVSRCVRG
jgi:hypothetical protein